MKDALVALSLTHFKDKLYVSTEEGMFVFDKKRECWLKYGPDKNWTFKNEPNKALKNMLSRLL